MIKESNNQKLKETMEKTWIRYNNTKDIKRNSGQRSKIFIFRLGNFPQIWKRAQIVLEKANKNVIPPSAYNQFPSNYIYIVFWLFFESVNRMLCRVLPCYVVFNQDHFFHQRLRTDGFKPNVNVESYEDQRHHQQRQAFNLSYIFPHRNFTKTLPTIP